MTAGKNKRISKGKKGGKKKIIDPFSRKEWYNIQAPALFKQNTLGWTLVNRSQGMRNCVDDLKGRVFEASLGDLNKDEEQSFRKMTFVVEDVVNNDCLTGFHGMSITSDKLKSMIKKWQSLVEINMDVKTSDGYLLRVFVIGFTKRRQRQVKKTCYAQAAQIRQIRVRAFEIIQKEASCDLKDLIKKLTTETIGKQITTATNGIYPLQNVYVRKVKVLKSPKTDLNALLEMHETGKKVDGGFKEPEILEEV